MSGLGDDYWLHDEATQSLHGRRTRMSYHLAQDVEVRLQEATPLTGGLLFSMVAPARVPGAVPDGRVEDGRRAREKRPRRG